MDSFLILFFSISGFLIFIHYHNGKFSFSISNHDLLLFILYSILGILACGGFE